MKLQPNKKVYLKIKEKEKNELIFNYIFTAHKPKEFKDNYLFKLASMYCSIGQLFNHTNFKETFEIVMNGFVEGITENDNKFMFKTTHAMEKFISNFQEENNIKITCVVKDYFPNNI